MVYAPHEARTLTVVRGTHADHGSSDWSGSVVNEPGLGYHLVSGPKVKGHVQWFPTLDLLVQHYAHHPYEIDFAGGRCRQDGPSNGALAQG